MNLPDFSPYFCKNRNFCGNFKKYLQEKSIFYRKICRSVSNFDLSEPFRSICVTYGHLLIRKLQTNYESSMVAVIVHQSQNKQLQSSVAEVILNLTRGHKSSTSLKQHQIATRNVSQKYPCAACCLGTVRNMGCDSQHLSHDRPDGGSPRWFQALDVRYDSVTFDACIGTRCLMNTAILYRHQRNISWSSNYRQRRRPYNRSCQERGR